MSIQSEIDRIKGNVSAAYNAVSDKGGTIPQEVNSDNLAKAVQSIPNITIEEFEAALSTKQDKLTGGTYQIVGFDANGNAIAVNRWSNPNLLHNWDFRNPVNQNGQTEYTSSGIYTIDRFSLQNLSKTASLKVGEGYIILNAKNNDGIIQMFEFPPFSLGKTYTSSVLTKDGELLTTTFQINSTDIVTHKYGSSIWQMAIGVDPYSKKWKCWPIITYNNQETVEIAVVAAKLELGDQQTLARKNTDGEWEIIDPPNPDLQYALCSLYSPKTGEWVGYQHSNPNLLDNWYFADPINQRGQTTYTSAGYSIDRWILRAGTLTLADTGITLSAPTDNLGFIQHIIETPARYHGMQITYSVLFSDGTLSTGTGTIPNNVPTGQTAVIANNSFSGGSTAVYYETGGRMVAQITINQSISRKIIALKLELGTIQTLARKEGDTWVLNDPPPNKQQELAKCQRYFIAINYSIGRAISCAISDGNGIISFPIALPTNLRANPTCKVMGQLRVAYSSGYVDVTANSTAIVQGHIAGISVEGLTPLTTYSLDSRTGGTIYFDANL